MLLLDRSFQYDPWQLLREMTKWTENAGLGGRTQQAYPAVNIWGNENQLILTAELPDTSPETLDIKVVQNVITIRGERKANEGDRKISYHRQERPQGVFQRNFNLPFHVNSDKVEAKYEKGILTVVLPRAEEDKPKQIKIKTS